MAVLTTKDRAALGFIYELDEFKSFKKWCNAKRQKVAEQIIGIDMSQDGADKRIAMLQGQAYTLEFFIKEWQKIHRQEIDKAIAEKKPKR